MRFGDAYRGRWLFLLLLGVVAYRLIANLMLSGASSECIAEHASVRVEGVLAEVASRGPGWQAALTVDRVDRCPSLDRQRLRISIHDVEVEPRSGQRWQVDARLRPPWGSLNPGGFNYRLWLVSRQFKATGYASQARCLEHCDVRPALADRQYDGIIRALAVGDRSAVSAEQWALFRDTGTIHLMVVSGLHVGMFAGIVVGLVSLLARLTAPLLRCVISPRWPLLAGAISGLLYAHTCGWGAPVARAAAGLLVVTLLLGSHRQGGGLRTLCLLAIAMLIVHPVFSLQQGFWLSYGAVAFLLVYFGFRVRAISAVRAFVACQVVLFVALAPLQAYLVGGVPALTPLANLVAVPLVSLIIVPSSLIGTLLQNLGLAGGDGLLRLADVAIHVVVAFLERLPQFTIGHSARQPLVGCTAGFFCLLVAPNKVRLVGAFAAFGWSVSPLVSVWPGEARIVVMDVGQGGAALVDTARHRLVVDTGPKFRSGLDMGAAVVLPTIRATGPDTVHRILLTHLDLDHAGGFKSVADRYPEADVHGLLDCREQRWSWDGVLFEVLTNERANTSNDASCTLLVTARSGRAYLSGDIGRRTELALLPDLPRNVDLLIAPHHGSDSSSHPAFVARLKPRWVVVSASRFNRYGHPRSTVVERYLASGARVLQTGIAGAIVWRSDARRVVCRRTRVGSFTLPLISEFDETTQVPGERPLFLGCQKLPDLDFFAPVTDRQRGSVSGIARFLQENPRKEALPGKSRARRSISFCERDLTCGKGDYLLPRRSFLNDIEASPNDRHFEERERQNDPIALHQEEHGDGAGDGEQDAQKRERGSPRK